jgi:oligopeptide/dipeptide ABC transporter ATP-binding protein
MLEVAPAPAATEPLVSARGVKTYFPVRSRATLRVTGRVHAVDGVDLDIFPGETLGLVGESGCGKSTLCRTVVRLVEPTEGEIDFDGRDVLALRRRDLRRFRGEAQFIFQDPAGSLNPRKTVRQIVSAGLTVHGNLRKKEREQRTGEILERVGLSRDALGRHPHEFSGGQRQRIGIARALVLKPRFVVADEPVSALDVSVQSQILNLLIELKRDFNLTYLFVAHDMAVVNYIADRVAVMYLGKVVEVAPANTIYTEPLHPYTTALLSSVPDPTPGAKRERIVLAGNVPSALSPPSGCRFRTRCPIAQPICTEVVPPLASVRDGHDVACHFPGQL